MEIPFVIYSESTPNPAVMKFVSNKNLCINAQEYLTIKDTEKNTLPAKLFLFPFVKEVFIASNYISIKKHELTDWVDVTNQIRIFIQEELNQKTPITQSNLHHTKGKGNKTKLIHDIEQVLNTTIRPNIQMDGGDIELVSCEKGILKLFLKGACSGCPSSQMTLKDGIETLLKSKFPDKIKEVVAINT